MSFTGRLGTPNTQFGNIVFGAVDGLGPGGPDFQAHQLTSRTVRVLYSVRVTEDALDPSRYAFASLSPATVPGVESVAYYDETLKSVVVTFSAPLTTGAQYSVTADGIQTVGGDVILAATRNFSANVFDPPRALGAYLSTRSSVDILFDKPVGPYSSGASFWIRDAAGGPLTAMTQSLWSGEAIPETTLRVSFSSVPVADAYVIEFSAVQDFSLNQSSGVVPLTLVLRSPAPHSYADLVQLQITDAFVTDVSSDFFRTANVRVFFSCPVLDADDPSNWAASATPGHRQTDTVDVVTEPAATDEPSLILLVNDLKAQLNGHVSIDQVHFAPALADGLALPDASTLAEAVDIVNALAGLIPSHYARPRVHSWPDTLNSVVVAPVAPGDLPGAIAAANSLRASYVGHVASSYPLQFSTAYHAPLGEVTAYAREAVADQAFDVSGPYTYFADLRLVLDSEVPAVELQATLTSEDSGSTTNPGDYTGSVSARPAGAPVTLRSSLVLTDRWVEVLTDRNVGLVSDDPLVVVDPSGEEVPSDAEVRGSLPALLWAYNQALESYRQHIVPGAAGHQVTDDVNLVTFGDYAFLPLSSAMSSVNGVRTKVMSHMASAIYHYHADPSMVTAPEATDLDSLMALVADLTAVLSDHLVKVGPHLFSGYRMVSAPVFDTVRVLCGGMVDGGAQVLSGGLTDLHVYNGLPRVPAPSEAVPVSHSLQVSTPFLGLAVRPSLASALPRSGLQVDADGIEHQRYLADAVELFFSKPMREVPLDSSNVPVVGGSIQQKEAAWASPLVASVTVIKMEPINYSVSAVGLSDLAGNAVY